MSFEQIYDRYMNGTATEEEIKYVEEEIEKARKLTELIDKKEIEKPVIEEASVEQVKKAKKKFSIKTGIRTLIIAFVVIILVSGAVCGGVFGFAATSADKVESISENDAKSYAIRYVENNFGDVGQINVMKIYKELQVGRELSDSFYVYEITLHANTMEIELVVDTRNGYVVIDDVDSIYD